MDQILTVDGVAEAFVRTKFMTALIAITPSFLMVVSKEWLCRFRTTFVFPAAIVGNVSAMTFASWRISTLKSLRYSLFEGFPSFALETRAKRVCEGPVVAVHDKR